jgi:hypothetical protein
VIDWEFREHLKSDRDILIIKAPVRHGKSEFLSKWAPTWYLLRRPFDRLIVATHTAGLAKDWSRWVRDKVHELSPMVRLKGVDPTHSSANNWQLEGTGGGTISAGVGGAIVGYGADLFLIDDYVRSARDAISETNRNVIWDWFTAVATTRLSPRGKVVILSTQWHEDDLIGRLMKRKEDLGLTVRCVTLQAICEDRSLAARDWGSTVARAVAGGVTRATTQDATAEVVERVVPRQARIVGRCRVAGALLREHLERRMAGAIQLVMRGVGSIEGTRR